MAVNLGEKKVRGRFSIDAAEVGRSGELRKYVGQLKLSEDISIARIKDYEAGSSNESYHEVVFSFESNELNKIKVFGVLKIPAVTRNVFGSIVADIAFILFFFREKIVTAGGIKIDILSSKDITKIITKKLSEENYLLYRISN